MYYTMRLLGQTDTIKTTSNNAMLLVAKIL